MEEQIFNSFFKEGGYALLFVWMLFSTMKNNKEREVRYQEVIDKNQTVIEKQAEAFTSLAKDVHEIKQIIVDEKGCQQRVKIPQKRRNKIPHFSVSTEVAAYKEHFDDICKVIDETIVGKKLSVTEKKLQLLKNITSLKKVIPSYRL